MRFPSPFPLVLTGVLSLASADVSAALRLASLFGDHMVWPSGAPAKVWGKAEPGAEVVLTLSLGQETKTTQAKAGADGRWKASFEAVAAGQSGSLKVKSGTEEVNCADLLTGEVWLCSGQSNMVFVLSKSKDGPAVAKAHRDQKIRLFTVGRKPSPEPLENAEGRWTVASPEAVANFSAVGYYFAMDRRQAHPDTPLGLVGSYWGGTPAEAWTPAKTLAGEAAYDSFTKPYAEKLAAGKTAAKTPDGKTDESAPGGPKAPSNLYNGMIAPLAPFRFKGVLWYQGESNAGKPDQYAKLFPAMIQSWRGSFEDENLPFLFVLLAGFQNPQAKPHEGGWALLREAQLAALSLPHTAVASALDVGDPKDIHPTNKKDVGLRLSLAARAFVDGEKIPGSGPRFRSLSVVSGRALVDFEFSEGGIRAYPDGPPQRYPLAQGGRWIGGYVKAGEPEVLVLPSADAPIEGFAIRGADGVWHEAKAVWEGFTLAVSSPLVPEPLAVSYGWASCPKANAYGVTGLPLLPFRSDSPNPPPYLRKRK